MIRLLIADDETSACDDMIRCIDWDKYGIEIIGVAADGPFLPGTSTLHTARGDRAFSAEGSRGKIASERDHSTVGQTVSCAPLSCS